MLRSVIDTIANFGADSTKPPREHKPGFIRRIVNQWWDRLLGAASDGSFASQDEEYEAHQTSRDYVWNIAGQGAWGMLFPILTIVVTQVAGVELAGMFSLAFITAMLLMIVANYGVRTFQVSDIKETYSFSDYQVNRWITCIAMLIIGVLYCTIRGYESSMLTISLGLYFYKMVDGLADVYEGRLQQVDKMYLAGVSLTLRSVACLIVFCIVLLVSKNVGAASIAMGVTNLIGCVLLTMPLALLETPKSRRINFSNVIALFKHSTPLFLALFMYSLIDNMPKFVMEGVLSYDNQLYFNVLYFPASWVLMFICTIYRPQLVRIANIWADETKRHQFDLISLGIVVLVIATTGVAVLFMATLGIPLFSFLYGLDFDQFRGLSYVMIVAGGVTALIDFLYQIITVLRRQGDVIKIYLLTFVFSIFIPVLLINFTGLPGAIVGYLIVMTLLLVLLAGEYFSIRMEIRNRIASARTRGAVRDKGSRTTSRHSRNHRSSAKAATYDSVRARRRAQAGDAGFDAGEPASYDPATTGPLPQIIVPEQSPAAPSQGAPAPADTAHSFEDHRGGAQ